MKLNAVGTALLFLAAIYLAAWTALPDWPLATLIAVLLTVLAPSAEGLAAMTDLIRRGHPLSELRDLNIDAIAAWAFKGLRIDDLPRAMWYSATALDVARAGPDCRPRGHRGRGAAATIPAIAIAGLALGASVVFNPLVGAVFCGVYGLAVTIDAARRPGGWPDILRHSLAVLPVVLALAWCSINQVGDGAGDVLHFGFWGLARNATVMTFLLSFGPILIPMAVGLWPKGGDSFASAWPAIAGVILSVLLMHLVALTVDLAWVGFRGGQLFFVFAPAIVARGLVRLWNDGFKQAAIGVAAIVAVAGLPTTVIDAYNTQDVTNRNFSPRAEYHWTVYVTAPEQEALDWIKANTPADAVVQAEPMVRGRETWSLIPTFAERRMATGNPVPLLALPEYTKRNERVKRVYETADAESAWRESRALGIDDLYVDATERGAYPQVVKFDTNPQYFTAVFRNSEAVVYEIKGSG